MRGPRARSTRSHRVRSSFVSPEAGLHLLALPASIEGTFGWRAPVGRVCARDGPESKHATRARAGGDRCPLSRGGSFRLADTAAGVDSAKPRRRALGSICPAAGRSQRRKPTTRAAFCTRKSARHSTPLWWPSTNRPLSGALVGERRDDRRVRACNASASAERVLSPKLRCPGFGASTGSRTSLRNATRLHRVDAQLSKSGASRYARPLSVICQFSG